MILISVVRHVSRWSREVLLTTGFGWSELPPVGFVVMRARGSPASGATEQSWMVMGCWHVNMMSLHTQIDNKCVSQRIQTIKGFTNKPIRSIILCRGRRIRHAFDLSLAHVVVPQLQSICGQNSIPRLSAARLNRRCTLRFL